MLVKPMPHTDSECPQKDHGKVLERIHDILDSVEEAPVVEACELVGFLFELHTSSHVADEDVALGRIMRGFENTDDEEWVSFLIF